MHRSPRFSADLAVPRVLRAEVAVLKAIAFRYVMADPTRRALQHRQQEVLEDLVTALVERGPEALDPVFGEAFLAATDDAARVAGGDRPGRPAHRRAGSSTGIGAGAPNG
jgi:dGTPase